MASRRAMSRRPTRATRRAAGLALVLFVILYMLIDRTEFGITFNAPVPGSGGVMVSERIQIEIEAEAVLRQQQG